METVCGGMYCPEGSTTMEMMCPENYYCPTPFEKYECSTDMYCPKGSSMNDVIYKTELETVLKLIETLFVSNTTEEILFRETRMTGYWEWTYPCLGNWIFCSTGYVREIVLPCRERYHLRDYSDFMNPAVDILDIFKPLVDLPGLYLLDISYCDNIHGDIGEALQVLSQLTRFKAAQSSPLLKGVPPNQLQRQCFQAVEDTGLNCRGCSCCGEHLIGDKGGNVPNASLRRDETGSLED